MLSRAKILFGLRPALYMSCRCAESTDAASKTEFFIQKNVQKLLFLLTKMDLEKVFEPRPIGKPLASPNYKLLTSEEVEREQQQSYKRARMLLQMPPVLEPTNEVTTILSEDPALDGHDIHHSKHVFIDISFDLKPEERAVVVREPNGILRQANRSERSRVNLIYEPVEGKELETPKMFEEEHFMDVLNRNKYKFILDRACIQFEPDDPIYVNITRKTYDTINERGHYDELQSTRHYGSMVFYLAINKNIDKLLEYFIQCDRLNDAYLLVELYCAVHPESSSAKASEKGRQKMLETYIAVEAKAKDSLELALQTLVSKYEMQQSIETV